MNEDEVWLWGDPGWSRLRGRKRRGTDRQREGGETGRRQIEDRQLGWGAADLSGPRLWWLFLSLSWRARKRDYSSPVFSSVGGGLGWERGDHTLPPRFSPPPPPQTMTLSGGTGWTEPRANHIAARSPQGRSACSNHHGDKWCNLIQILQEGCFFCYLFKVWSFVMHHTEFSFWRLLCWLLARTGDPFWAFRPFAVCLG